MTKETLGEKEITTEEIKRFHKLLDLMNLRNLQAVKFNVNHRIKMKKLTNEK